MTSRSGLRRGCSIALATAATLHALAARADETGVPRPEGAGGWATTLDFVAHLGGSIRLGAAPSLMITDRTGLLAGGGIVLAPSRLFSIDLAYEHLSLGAERLGNGGVGSASVERDAHALWADVRVFPVRSLSFSVLAGIGLGLAWQSAQASILTETLTHGGAIPVVQLFQCKASAPASIALRGNAGVEVPITGGLMVVGEASFENARLSGELLDGCISGAGTTTLLALRAGLAYRLDLSTLFR